MFLFVCFFRLRRNEGAPRHHAGGSRAFFVFKASQRASPQPGSADPLPGLLVTREAAAEGSPGPAALPPRQVSDFTMPPERAPRSRGRGRRGRRGGDAGSRAAGRRAAPGREPGSGAMRRTRGSGAALSQEEGAAAAAQQLSAGAEQNAPAAPRSRSRRGPAASNLRGRQ